MRQLYTNYNIFFPKEESRKLVILPDPYAHYDTFQNITESVVKPTGLLICPPREEDNQGRLTMVIPMKNDRSLSKRIPINVGLHLITQKRPANKPFLPVLVKGDLRELDPETPCLHLHALQIHQLNQISELERKDIAGVISERLSALAK